MNKKIILILIPILIIAAFLINCWIKIIYNHIHPDWRQYLGLLFFMPATILLYKKLNSAILYTGFYLLVGITNSIYFTYSKITSSIRIGSITTPDFNPVSLGLFILYVFLNMISLIEMYLDYKEQMKD